MARITNAEPDAQKATDPAERFFAHIERSGALPPNVTPTAAASAVLCVLARRVSGGQAEDLREAMPEPLHDLFQPCRRQRTELAESFKRGEFVRRVAERLGISSEQAESVARAVFEALQVEVPSARKEVDDVESQLPQDLKDLWRRAR